MELPEVLVMEELPEALDFIAMHLEAGWLLLAREELPEVEMFKVLQVINTAPAPNIIVKPADQTDFDYAWPRGLRLWN
jgi:hypothetical protein